MRLRDHGFVVSSISEILAGITDEEVLHFAFRNKALLITEDSDFGTLIFEQNHTHSGVLFIRLQSLSRTVRIEIALDQITNNYSILKDQYNVLTVSGLRQTL